MPEQELSALIEESVTTVLETMFFADPLGPAEPGAEEGAPVLAARLWFHGSPSGNLAVCISQASARLLAAGFLGEDEESLTEAQTGQIVCELANMLCGSVVSRLESEKSFDLTSPELVPFASIFDSGPPGPACLRSFELENGILTVGLRLNRAA